jgi:nickel/cobalt transporter (NiCoT) family protein
MAAAILALHVVGFGLLLVVVPAHYHVGTKIFGVGTGLLAYTLGLRHAFDADHISAIDNTTRKLIGKGDRPLGVGFFFSLGHSTVVFVLAILLSLGIKAISGEVGYPASNLHHYAGLVSTTVSGTFLYLIALMNMVILVATVRVFMGMRKGSYDDKALEEQLDSRGFMMRFLGPVARRVDTSWKMYPVGVLFGLGFDTATEVALLVMAGTAVAANLPFYAILCLPLLFAAGMSLLDTIDGTFMNVAYGWAFLRPVRKVYYNITITGLSVMAAFAIGTIELMSIVGSEFQLSGGLWDWTSQFNINQAGVILVILFGATWLVALAVWRLGRVESRWEESAAARRADSAAPLEGQPILDEPPAEEEAPEPAVLTGG